MTSSETIKIADAWPPAGPGHNWSKLLSLSCLHIAQLDIGNYKEQQHSLDEMRYLDIKTPERGRGSLSLGVPPLSIQGSFKQGFLQTREEAALLRESHLRTCEAG